MVIKNSFLVILVLLAGLARLEAQQKYWIYLNDENTGLNISNAAAAGNPHMLNGISVAPLVYSNWLGAFSAELTPAQLRQIAALSVVDSVRPLNKNFFVASVNFSPKLEPHALEQINARALIEAGYRGKGVKIGIIDAGFYRADRQRALKGIIENGQLLGYRNYIENTHHDPFSIPDAHGTQVWKLIGGHMPSERVYFGMAIDASYFIARTDEDPAEYRAEEDYWIAALEWMHSQGVRIINSSLGYSDGHDDPTEDYRPEEADGKSSALTRAVNIATYEKGMLIIMSAGNSGDESFEVVNIPADSPGVIAVGSTNLKFWTKQDYSSIGRYTHPAIKPDVSCYSSTGTSFSAPVITGLAACILGADTTLTNLEVAELIKKSSNLRYFPNNYVGYGIPDAARMLDMLHEKWAFPEHSGQVLADGNVIEIALQAKNPVLFDKINEWEVRDQRTLQGDNSVWRIERPDRSITRTTFSTKSEAIEILWPD